jgi:integrase
MARKNSNALLNRTSRLSLPVRPRPYFAPLSKGLSLGYRRLPARKAGTWWARLVSPVTGEYDRLIRLGEADDYEPADGHAFLDHDQATDKARALKIARAKQKAGVIPNETTFAEAAERYMAEKEAENNLSRHKRNRILLVTRTFGHMKLADITTKQIKDWKLKVATSAPQRGQFNGNAAPDDPRRFKAFDPNDPEQTRRRRLTWNTLYTEFRGVANLAFQDGYVDDDRAWRRVKVFPKVIKARKRILTDDEIVKLLAECAPPLRDYVIVNLGIPGRFGEMAALTVGDYTPATASNAVGSVLIERALKDRPRQIGETKTGKVNRVYTTDPQVLACLDRLCRGRTPDEPLLLNRYGAPWTHEAVRKGLKSAARRAGIEPLGIHDLRRTYATRAHNAGVSLPAIASQLAHTNTVTLQTFYAFTEDRRVAGEVGGVAPLPTPTPAGANVVPLRKTRRTG